VAATPRAAFVYSGFQLSVPTFGSELVLSGEDKLLDDEGKLLEVPNIFNLIHSTISSIFFITDQLQLVFCWEQLSLAFFFYLHLLCVVVHVKKKIPHRDLMSPLYYQSHSCGYYC